MDRDKNISVDRAILDMFNPNKSNKYRRDYKYIKPKSNCLVIEVKKVEEGRWRMNILLAWIDKEGGIKVIDREGETKEESTIEIDSSLTAEDLLDQGFMRVLNWNDTTEVSLYPRYHEWSNDQITALAMLCGRHGKEIPEFI